MANIPKKVTDRFVKEIGGFQKVLHNAKDRDINESDTVAIIVDILGAVFGFDKYTEVTSEQCIGKTYCDLAVKLDNQIKYLIEVKSIGLTLKDNHLRQAIGYGATQGIPWVILTNGINWEIHRIRFEKPVQTDLVCSFDFLTLSPRKGEDQEKLFLLCKEGITKAAMDEFAERVQSVNRFMIGAVMLTDPVVSQVRRELRRMAPGLKVENGEIESIIKAEVFKREVIEGDFADRAKAIIKKANRAQKKVKPVPAEASA
jgi:hypothetical protein